jgi:hypothetical protein
MIFELSPSETLDERIFGTWYVVHLALAGV